MKKNATRIIALALIALMCLALLPMTAFASEDPPAPTTGAPQVELVRHIINGQPGEISGLTTDMEYANLDTNWGWVAATGETLQVFKSSETYFRYIGETPVSTITVLEYYTAAASAGEGGTVSPSDVQTVLTNSGVTFTFTPNEGYELEDVKLNGESVGAQSSYTVAARTTAATVTASFKRSTPQVTQYTVSFDA